MKFEYYLTALRHAAVVVGNSSSGIHEAPVYGVPSVNIGSRQHNRFEHPSIRPVPFEPEAIMAAIDACWGTRSEPTMHFGSGTSAESFMHGAAGAGHLADPRAQAVQRLIAASAPTTAALDSPTGTPSSRSTMARRPSRSSSGRSR